MRVLITGVAGFLGSHVADAVLKAGHYVVGVDNLIGGYRDNIPAHVRWHNINCCNWNDMDQAMKGVDLVYHCAATAYEGLSVFSPSIVSRNIMDASTTVFSTAIANKVKRIVHCSSMARYGSILTPYKENMVPRPQDPYGIAKLAAEQMLVNLCETHGVEYNIAVPHNIIGPRQKYDDPYRNVASIFMNLMLQGRTPVIYGDGTQQRCFSYVDDCIDCLTKMGTQDSLKSQIINIGPDEQPITINNLFFEVATVTGFKGSLNYMPGRPQEVKVALCCSTKARRLLSYETKTPLREGLSKMYSWMKERGAKSFNYHLPIEIVTEKTPATWTKRLF